MLCAAQDQNLPIKEETRNPTPVIGSKGNNSTTRPTRQAYFPGILGIFE